MRHSDLTDEELTAIEGRCRASIVELAALVAEIRRHRAAQTASEERVRTVVERAAADILGPNGPTCRDWSVAARAIKDVGRDGS